MIEQPLPALALINRVKISKGLIEEQQFWLVDEGRRKHHLLPLSFGEVFAHRISFLIQTKPIKPMFNLGFNVIHSTQPSYEF